MRAQPWTLLQRGQPGYGALWLVRSRKCKGGSSRGDDIVTSLAALGMGHVGIKVNPCRSCWPSRLCGSPLRGSSPPRPGTQQAQGTAAHALSVRVPSPLLIGRRFRVRELPQPMGA